MRYAPPDDPGLANEGVGDEAEGKKWKALHVAIERKSGEAPTRMLVEKGEKHEWLKTNKEHCL
jgi:hypothetical protein